MAGFLGGYLTSRLAANPSGDSPYLTILHTNDIHSHLDPFPPDHPNFPGLGGAARRAAIIREGRSRNLDTVVLDVGDLFMGTLYFEIYKGEADIRALSAQGYDASTIGNHEFDAGIGRLAEVIRHHAAFPFVSANYHCHDTPLEGLVRPYTVIRTPHFRVGVFGLGIKLAGLVPDDSCAGVQHSDPIAAARKYAAILRHDERCDCVIALSHLGNKSRGDQPGEQDIAAQTSGIDVILGGHSHTFFDAPQLARNADGHPVVVHQAGWAGVRMGRIELAR